MSLRAPALRPPLRQAPAKAIICLPYTGRAVDCAVEAQNSGFGVVGWKIVHLPASDQRSVTYTTSLATSERAVTGLIYRCWLP